ncbi:MULTISPECIES: tRNA1(Val) (adenine(37)-N6)-methyltransferase [Sediminimonas]|uniref:tRNA1(Val) (adenine(37)-N6)-methyltransferase n=1 Tax=Sediminimonas TaxID=659427 RepID=UPI00040F0C01|nr:MULTISPECIES: methyltransferase [Sediminimonas]MDR9484514.1 methyltransferase [Sediminimonas sp.]
MSDADLTHDAYLNGRFRVWQPARGYRAGIDPVLLAAAVPAQPGQSVLELGCGVGVASLALAARVPRLRLTGIEAQARYADLARDNAAQAGADLEVITGDLAQMPDALRQQQFDHVIANPPYYIADTRTAGRDAGREAAHAEATPLAEWIDAARRRTAPRGYLTLIHRAERLAALLPLVEAHFGGIEVLPLVPRTGRAAGLILLRARKGARAALCLHHGLVMHEGAAHDGDRESYSAALRAALRDGAALPWPSRRHL